MKEKHPELAVLLEKFRQGQCTDEEKARLMAWLDEMEQSAAPAPLPAPDTRDALRQAFINRVTGAPVRRLFPRRYIAAAAVAAVCLCTAAWIFLQQRPATPHLAALTGWDTLYAHPKEMRSIRLNDSSEVILNANSQIRISKGFGISDRTLEVIDGEAWFNVRKNAELPFVVQSGKTETRVLGTRFVVSAYKSLQRVAVQVTEGKVAVALPGKTYPAVTPGEAVYLRANGESVQESFDRPAFDPLHKSYFLRNSSFEELALRIQNTFGYTLVPQSPEVANRRFTGEFRQSEDIQHIIQKFSNIHNGSFRIEGDKVFMN